MGLNPLILLIVKNGKTTLIMVDAWGFYTGPAHGYIAYFFRSDTKKWIIKSFKKNTNPDMRNLAFKNDIRRSDNLH